MPVQMYHEPDKTAVAAPIRTDVTGNAHSRYVPTQAVPGTSVKYKLSDTYACACLVAGASAPARASLPPPHGQEACVKMHAYHNTHYVPVHNIVVDENASYDDDTRRRCVRMVCRRTPPPSSTPAHGQYLTFVILFYFFGVPAHTTFVHAGAWTVTNGFLSSAHRGYVHRLTRCQVP